MSKAKPKRAAHATLSFVIWHLFELWYLNFELGAQRCPP
jgi:hypothetical protein